jgi:hypothetical protein
MDDNASATIEINFELCRVLLGSYIPAELISARRLHRWLKSVGDGMVNKTATEDKI